MVIKEGIIFIIFDYLFIVVIFDFDIKRYSLKYLKLNYLYGIMLFYVDIFDEYNVCVMCVFFCI